MQKDERKEERTQGQQVAGSEDQPKDSRYEEIREVQDSQAGISGSEVMGSPGGSAGEGMNSEQGTRNAD